MLLFNNQRIATDAQGFLKNSTDWSEALAKCIAEQENIIMTDVHWELIRFVRTFYLQFNTSPKIRLLVSVLAQKYGQDKGNSMYLQSLFPQGPAKQAAKIAGLPKPVKCL